MKMIKAAGLLVALGLVLAGCGSGRSDVRAGDEASGRSRGQTLYVTECGSCHRLFRPSAYSREEWREIGPRMGKQAGLTAVEMAELLAYLEAATR